MKCAPLWLLTGCLLCTTAMHAQQRMYTIAEATNGLRTGLAPERLKQFEWVPGQPAFTRMVPTGAGNAWVKYTLPSMKADTLVTLPSLNGQFFRGSELRTLPAFHWISAEQAWFSSGDHLYAAKTNGNTVELQDWYALPEGAENITVSEDGNKAAFTVKNNVYLLSLPPGARPFANPIVQLTKDTSENIINGKTVHREEFGIDHGIFFSPKGNKLAWYRMDQRMVNDYPIVDWISVPAKNTNIKYPMAGGTSHEVTIGVQNTPGAAPVFLQTGLPADQYLTCVTWSPDEQSVYVALLNREQNHLRLNRYNAATGAPEATLFEEKSDKYIHPDHPLTFVPGHPDQFIWMSDRDGYRHLYLYNTSGKLLQQLTKGDWVVNDIIGFNSQTKEVVITAAKESPMEKHAYAVSLKNGVMRRLDDAAGWHEVQLNKDGSYLLDTWSSGKTPGMARLTALKGKWQHNLLEAADPLRDFKQPAIRNVTLSADDGTPLYGKLILPPDFDSTRQYPVIVYLYNGPNIQLIKNTFPASGNLWYDYMAQRGYIVFSMDGRGSANRGMKFEQATFHHLGNVEMNDQLKGVSYLHSLPYVDKQRMGVHGWSYGGFMTTSLMLRHPDVFQAAVGGGPVIDWSLYEVMYTERYMGTPQNNPEGYTENNLLTKTKNLKGHLMLIHGTNDDVVVWQHSLKFIKACVDNGVQLDYFVYPGHLHNVLGRDRVHLMQQVTDYFDLYLKK